MLSAVLLALLLLCANDSIYDTKYLSMISGLSAEISVPLAPNVINNNSGTGPQILLLKREILAPFYISLYISFG
jgi:hypothetical protein